MGKITITLREDHLPEGIVLAGKCRILRTLRMGEFSVTYEAMLGNRKVAVKEFYNRGCMYRQGNRVVLTNEEDQQEFEKAKQKLVEEARRLSKFASQPNVVRCVPLQYGSPHLHKDPQSPDKTRIYIHSDISFSASFSCFFLCNSLFDTFCNFFRNKSKSSSQIFL